MRLEKMDRPVIEFGPVEYDGHTKCVRVTVNGQTATWLFHDYQNWEDHKLGWRVLNRDFTVRCHGLIAVPELYLGHNVAKAKAAVKRLIKTRCAKALAA